MLTVKHNETVHRLQPRLNTVDMYIASDEIISGGDCVFQPRLGCFGGYRSNRLQALGRVIFIIIL